MLHLQNILREGYIVPTKKFSLLWFGVAGLLVSYMLFWGLSTVCAKELPDLSGYTETTLIQLRETNNLDWNKVALVGTVKAVQQLQGRRGSHYLLVVLEQNQHFIETFLFPVFPLGEVVGERVIILGKYRPRGRFGGFLKYDFLEISYIFRDWSKNP